MTPIEPRSENRRSGAWRDAVAVVAVIVTALLAARQLRPLVEAATFQLRTGEVPTNVTPTTWIRAGAWVGITALLLLRRFRVAAVGAWLAVGVEIVWAVPRIWGDPRYVVETQLATWPVLLALAAALGLTVVAVERRGPDLLSRRGWWLLAGAVALTAGSAVALPLAVTIPPPVYAIEEHAEATIALTTRAVVLAAAALVLLGVHRGLRGRAATVLAAGMAGALVLQVGLPAPLGATNITAPDRAVQAYGLILIPLLILAIGVGRYRRRAGAPAR